MRPNAFQEIFLRFLVLLLIANNVVESHESLNSLDDNLFSIEDPEMSYIDLYACINKDDFNTFFMNEYLLDYINPGLMSKIMYICNTQVNGKARKNLNILLDKILFMQAELLNTFPVEINFVDI